MLRIATAIGLWCLAVASALVAAIDYRIPLFISLVSTVLYAALVYPFWRDKRQRVLIFLASAPLAVFTSSTVQRLIYMLSR